MLKDKEKNDISEWSHVLRRSFVTNQCAAADKQWVKPPGFGWVKNLSHMEHMLDIGGTVYGIIYISHPGAVVHVISCDTFHHHFIINWMLCVKHYPFNRVFHLWGYWYITGSCPCFCEPWRRLIPNSGWWFYLWLCPIFFWMKGSQSQFLMSFSLSDLTI